MNISLQKTNSIVEIRGLVMVVKAGTLLTTCSGRCQNWHWLLEVAYCWVHGKVEDRW